MMTCKECGYCLPCGSKFMCLNDKNKQGDFVMFVKPDDDYDGLRHCGEKKGGERDGKL